jgi:hypothetical protein
VSPLPLQVGHLPLPPQPGHVRSTPDDFAAGGFSSARRPTPSQPGHLPEPTQVGHWDCAIWHQLPAKIGPYDGSSLAAANLNDECDGHSRRPRHRGNARPDGQKDRGRRTRDRRYATAVPIDQKMEFFRGTLCPPDNPGHHSSKTSRSIQPLECAHLAPGRTLVDLRLLKHLPSPALPRRCYRQSSFRHPA